MARKEFHLGLVSSTHLERIIRLFDEQIQLMKSFQDQWEHRLVPSRTPGNPRVYLQLFSDLRQLLVREQERRDREPVGTLILSLPYDPSSFQELPAVFTTIHEKGLRRILEKANFPSPVGAFFEQLLDLLKTVRQHQDVTHTGMRILDDLNDFEKSGGSTGNRDEF